MAKKDLQLTFSRVDVSFDTELKLSGDGFGSASSLFGLSPLEGGTKIFGNEASSS